MYLTTLLAQSSAGAVDNQASGERMAEKPMGSWKLRAPILDRQGDALPPSNATIEAWDRQLRAIRASEALPVSSDPERDTSAYRGTPMPDKRSNTALLVAEPASPADKSVAPINDCPRRVLTARAGRDRCDDCGRMPDPHGRDRCDDCGRMTDPHDAATFW